MVVHRDYFSWRSCCELMKLEGPTSPADEPHVERWKTPNGGEVARWNTETQRGYILTPLTVPPA